MITRLSETARRLLFRAGTVTSITTIHPHMRQFRIADESLRGLHWQAGQHIRLSLSKGLPLLRTYTVRHYDSEQGSIDIWIMLHGEGPGCQWANTVKEGETVAFLGPTGSFVLPAEAAPYYLFVGEETAAVSFQIMLETLPEHATVLGCLETRAPGEEVPGASSHQLPWVYRGETSALSSALLLKAVQSLELPASPGLAFLAGEARTCQAVRRHLIAERHWPRTAIHVKAFWTPGKTGMD